MAKKDNVVALFLEQVGIPELFGIIIGVPAMITLIVTIWDALTQTQQITIIVCGILIIVFISLFIRGRVRKVLFIIPRLLYRKHKLAASIAENIQPAWSETSMDNLLKLQGVDIESLEPLIQDTLNARQPLESSNIIDLAKAQSKGKESTEKDMGFMVSEFLGEQSGFNKALENNGEYKKLQDKLEVWKNIAPTEGISASMNEYERSSYLLNSLTLLTESSLSLGDMPQKYRLQITVNDKKREDKMNNLLAKVRESITKYYRE